MEIMLHMFNLETFHLQNVMPYFSVKLLPLLALTRNITTCDCCTDMVRHLQTAEWTPLSSLRRYFLNCYKRQFYVYIMWLAAQYSCCVLKTALYILCSLKRVIFNPYLGIIKGDPDCKTDAYSFCSLRQAFGYECKLYS